MKILKKFLKTLLFVFVGFIALVLVYLLSARVLSRITVNADANADDDPMEIYVMSNGVHTDLVFPTKTDLIDWGSVFPYENILGRTHDFPYTAIGWGDKGFYLNTPEWKDLTAATAIKAATGIGETALHVTYYRQITLDAETKKIMVSKAQYQKLIDYVERTIKKGDNGKAQFIETDAQYGKTDAFYEANGSYSVFFTCNSWTNDALKQAGIKACKWTAFDQGILLQYATD